MEKNKDVGTGIVILAISFFFVFLMIDVAFERFGERFGLEDPVWPILSFSIIASLTAMLLSREE